MLNGQKICVNTTGGHDYQTIHYTKVNDNIEKGVSQQMQHYVKTEQEQYSPANTTRSLSGEHG